MDAAVVSAPVEKNVGVPEDPNGAYNALKHGADYDEVLPALIEGLSKSYRQVLKDALTLQQTKPFTVEKI